MPAKVGAEFRDYLDALMSGGDRAITARELGQLVDEIVSTLDGDLDFAPRAGAASARDETPDGDAVRAALAPLHADTPDQTLFETLHGELETIVRAAQEAAEAILAATEAINSVSNDAAAGDQAALTEAVTEIYQACGFQDLTGQRVARIGQLLNRVEYHVAGAQAVLGDDDAAQRERDLAQKVEQQETREVEHILHGPQDAGTANSQEEIDKILASFD
ncbi:MAG: protein phosphatase CheZ [Alphaproteobacteria bacterium]|nr:protein phosphatase CheZ [Alphaproteobacteria bacterium]